MFFFLLIFLQSPSMTFLGKFGKIGLGRMYQYQVSMTHQLVHPRRIWSQLLTYG